MSSGPAAGTAEPLTPKRLEAGSCFLIIVINVGLDAASLWDAGEAERLLADWPAEPTAAQRRHLAAVFLAGGEQASALVQWLRLPATERRAGDWYISVASLPGLAAEFSLDTYLIEPPKAPVYFSCKRWLGYCPKDHYSFGFGSVDLVHWPRRRLMGPPQEAWPEGFTLLRRMPPEDAR